MNLSFIIVDFERSYESGKERTWRGKLENAIQIKPIKCYSVLGWHNLKAGSHRLFENDAFLHIP